MIVYPPDKFKYHIVVADSRKSLCEDVIRLINDGYEPLGGVCVERIGDRVQFYQAMQPQGRIVT